MAKLNLKEQNHIVILVPIGHVDHGKTTLNSCYHKELFCSKSTRKRSRELSKISIKLQKRESVVSQSLQLTLSIRQRRDIMHTLTAQDMLTT